MLAREQMLARSEAHLARSASSSTGARRQAAKAANDCSERLSQVEAHEDELRQREARLGADLELREDKLERLAEQVADRERRLTDREQDLASYVGELQQQIA